MRETGRLDCAMTNREARPHLVKSYKGMESPGFNGHVYTGICYERRTAKACGSEMGDEARHQPERL